MVLCSCSLFIRVSCAFSARKKILKSPIGEALIIFPAMVAILRIVADTIKEARISAGGVAPIPLFLEKTSQFLAGKTINEELIFQVIEIMQSEISPISDARGSKEYKALLLGQLIKAHFIKLFPKVNSDALVS